ncbi:MAG: 8-amino-7-oxononanoate synthase [Actinomycetota bacterium]|nr:8-amino-7-oxononanoate synthase [Actinomycetota bacterium]MDQ6944813.1 8-amino-7-oxononanoate synthase [Actinomycetota bacterium]
MTWPAWIADQLAATAEAGRWRQVNTYDGRGTTLVTADGRTLTSFAANDYLGLAGHPATVAAAHDALDRWGAGTGSARLIVGSRPIHAELERALAEWRGTEAALVTPTGYQANLAVLSAFGPGARIVSDELNHASIIDGARLARTDVGVYRHGDVDHADALVAQAGGRALVVTDSVFSMDGDVAPVTELSACCARRGALLVLDDAHAVLDVPDADPEAACIRVGTLSKALGALGGYVAGSRAVVDVLVNRARPFIFTTAPAPAPMAAALAAVEICRSPEGDALRGRLRHHVDAVRPGHPSPIIPFVIGGEKAALAAAAKLVGAGLVVPAIRPPTVPVGTSRLRVALSAGHTDDQVAALTATLDCLGLRCCP